MKAKLLFVATLAMALLGSVVSSLAVAAEANAGRPLTRTEVRAEAAGARASGQLRQDNDAQTRPTQPYRLAGVSQWRVREEARAAVRRGSTRAGEHVLADAPETGRPSTLTRAAVRTEMGAAGRREPQGAAFERGQ